MTEVDQVDLATEKLLDYLINIQNKDGSFDTMCFQPRFPQEGWVKWQRNAPVDTASVLIPLLFLDNPKASLLIDKGVQFIIERSLDKKLWRYAHTDKYIIPYDIDSTCQCSYVLANSNHKVNNKEFLNLFISSNKHYKLFLFPKKFTTKIPLDTFFKLKWHHLNSSEFDLINIMEDDWDFATTCNSLLYIGKCDDNKDVWDEIKRNFEGLNLETTYYSGYYEFYAYSRLMYYGGYDELRPNERIIEKYIDYFKDAITPPFIDQLLFVNSLLFLNYDFHDRKEFINQCIIDIHQEKYKENAPYYSSNVKSTIQPQTNEPLIYFGHSSITTSLYIEFLNLYRKLF